MDKLLFRRSGKRKLGQLVRLIFGKPQHEKPELGKPPAYITNDKASPSSPAITKFNAFRQALIQDKKGLSIYRKDFLDACISYADALRVRERPNVDSLGKKSSKIVANSSMFAITLLIGFY